MTTKRSRQQRTGAADQDNCIQTASTSFKTDCKLFFIEYQPSKWNFCKLIKFLFKNLDIGKSITQMLNGLMV
jgi:hypothetical protein